MEDVLQLSRIQANCLVGFNKPFQMFIAFSLDNVPKARAWLRTLKVTTSDSALQFKTLRRQVLAAGGIEPVSAQFNVLLSAKTLTRLLLSPQDLGDVAFAEGMAQRASIIGDPNRTTNWSFGNTAHPADIVLIAASESKDRLENLVVDLLGKTAGVTETWRQLGEVRSGDQRGHEHFGFNDGISQPGIRGLRSPASADFFEPRRLDPTDPSLSNPNQPEFAAPGRPLVWPGQFVFGYSRQSETDPRGALPAASLPAWAKNGSLCVIRQLRQDVAGFEQFVTEGAATLGIDRGLFAAQVVGRWPSGAPIMRFPNADPGPEIGDDPNTNNAFGYFNAAPSMKLIDGTVVSATPSDQFAKRCPFGAHLRKVNPRDAPTDDPSPTMTLRRRILRRGIPYGPSFTPETSNVNRGLMFVCYQTNIEAQFEFIQQDWMNHADRPSQGGFDLLVGQNPAGDRRREAMFNGKAGPTLVQALTQHVEVRGGEYLFSPSVDFLTAL